MLEETLPDYSLLSNFTGIRICVPIHWNLHFLPENCWMCGIVPTNVCNRTVFSVLSPTGPNGYSGLDPVSSAIRQPERRGPASSLPRVQGAAMSHSVLIVDDNAVVRRLVRACIERDRDWDICGEADNGKVAVEKVKELHPEIVILDFQMPVMNDHAHWRTTLEGCSSRRYQRCHIEIRGCRRASTWVAARVCGVRPELSIR